MSVSDTIQDQDQDQDQKWEILMVKEGQNALIKGALTQISPFETTNQRRALNALYVVEPRELWTEMSKFNTCISEQPSMANVLYKAHAVSLVSDETYQRYQYVYVKPSGDRLDALQPDDIKENDFWVAKILEFKAADEANVYARIYWMYWPGDLPKCKEGRGPSVAGARYYHGESEMIASNHMDVINVYTFAGVATVRHWDESDNEEIQPGLFWRQTLDHRTAELSVLPDYCACNRHYNPDKITVQCLHDGCKVWLHNECLIHSVLAKTYHSRIETAGSPVRKRRDTEGKQPYEGLFTAKVLYSEFGPLKTEITDLRSANVSDEDVWQEDILCPKCDTVIG